jgi:hypothetical protein
MTKPTGYILYEGPSELDGKPIVVIATGFGKRSRNIKTGAMIQTWIMRSDISPLEAVHNGEDASICGDCKHRGILELQEDGTTRNKLRMCYVLEFQAPLAIYRAFKRGSYADTAHWSPSQKAGLFKERVVRLGAYGDPAAAPDRVWAYATLEASRWAGYTHQWSTLPATSILRTLAMASVDSPTEAASAQGEGWRTFRVGEAPTVGEISCPATAEGGEKAKCADCGLCAGAFRQARNITLKPHGNRVATIRKRAPHRLAVV